VKGGDYQAKEDVVGWEVVEAYGGKVQVLDMVESVSTTAIVNRIQESGAD
jgi:D-beta-D-heptose 7-phosphate kinase/D-beta-D-heptose 1-phosphate adenosyltransferase